MKRGKKLIALCGVLVVLVAAYAVTRTLTAEPEEDGGVSVAALDGETLTGLSWTADGETLSLVKEGDSWSYEGDSSFPLDAGVPERMLAALADVTASRAIDSPEALSEYGLDEPALTITAAAEDGTQTTFALGDLNEMTDEYYLLCNGDESRLYLVDSTLYDAFHLGLYDMVEMELLPDFGTVVSLDIDQPGGSLSLRYVEDSADLYFNSGYHWFLERDGAQLALDTSSVSSLYGNVTGLSWLSCAAYHVSEEDLAGYGLDDGSAVVVTLTYELTETVETGETDEEGNPVTEERTTTYPFVLRIGDGTEEGAYTMLNGSDMVYLIDAETADALRYASYASLRPSALCDMGWDTVNRLEVTAGGVDTAISFDIQEVETTDENGETVTETAPLYTADGAELDSDAVEAVLDAIADLTITGQASGGAGTGTALAQFTFHREGEALSRLTLALYEYDAGSCLASFHGEDGLLVERSAVDSLLDLLDTALAD